MLPISYLGKLRHGEISVQPTSLHFFFFFFLLIITVFESESHVAQAGLELSIVAKVDLELLTSAPDLSLLGRQVCWALSGRRPPF